MQGSQRRTCRIVSGKLCRDSLDTCRTRVFITTVFPVNYNYKRIHESHESDFRKSKENFLEFVCYKSESSGECLIKMKTLNIEVAILVLNV